MYDAATKRAACDNNSRLLSRNELQSFRLAPAKNFQVRLYESGPGPEITGRAGMVLARTVHLARGDTRMGIGLTFEEYVDLRLRPLAASAPVFSDAAEREWERMFF